MEHRRGGCRRGRSIPVPTPGRRRRWSRASVRPRACRRSPVSGFSSSWSLVARPRGRRPATGRRPAPPAWPNPPGSECIGKGKVRHISVRRAGQPGNHDHVAQIPGAPVESSDRCVDLGERPARRDQLIELDARPLLYRRNSFGTSILSREPPILQPRMLWLPPESRSRSVKRARHRAASRPIPGPVPRKQGERLLDGARVAGGRHHHVEPAPVSQRQRFPARSPSAALTAWVAPNALACSSLSSVTSIATSGNAPRERPLPARS